MSSPAQPPEPPQRAQTSDGPVATVASPPAPAAWTPPAFAESPASVAAQDRPELAVGGAFAGGIVLALMLKRLAR